MRETAAVSSTPAHPNPSEQFRNLPPRERRRYLIATLLRAVISTGLVLAVYFVLPFDNFAQSAFWLTLALSLLVVALLVVVEVRAVLRAQRPGGRAVQAIAIALPAFVTVFAIAYFMLSHSAPSNFNDPDLTKVDSLYFTMTVLTTVGFGDIVATSQFARAVVIVQEALDLIVVGLVIRVFVAAVQEAWKRHDVEGSVLLGPPTGGPVDEVVDEAADDVDPRDPSDT
jgi:cell division protein FtsW (lipid II flippase)